MKQKLKMNSKTYNTICIPIVAVLLVAVFVLPYIANIYSSALDNYLGKGEQVIEVVEGSENWDTNYYTALYDNIADARELNSANVALEIAEEGITLLKNNGVLPLEKGTAVTPYGLRYIDPLYGGTGSGNVDVSMDYVDTAVEMMNEYFTIDPTVQSKLEAATHYYLAAPTYLGETPAYWADTCPVDTSATMFVNHSWLDEYNPAEVYDDEFKAASQGTVAVVFLGRVGGESNDIYSGEYGPYADGSAHELQLSDYERETIRVAKANSEKVIVVLETSNVMEIGELAAAEGELAVDAIIWMGGAGAKGFRGLVEIMTGEVNPSGHLPDTWMASIHDDPTSANLDEYAYTNIRYSDGSVQYMMEYDEGIYMGYRYYETVYDLNNEFTVNGQTVGYGELDSNGNVTTAGAVVYPFGYGLSYGADFAYEITSTKVEDGAVTMTVKVTNNGTEAAKDAVQLYYTAPYTDLDIEYGIEKSTAVLLAYDKTGDIAPGGSEEVTFSFLLEDMASYCDSRDNGNGTIGCYMLEAGSYTLTVRANSHDILDSETVTVDSTIWYDGSDEDHIRQSEKDAQDTAGGSTTGAASYIAATNQFQESTDHMNAKTDTLTRASGVLVNTAQSPTAEDLVAPEGIMERIETSTYFDPATDEKLGNVEGSEIYAADAPASGIDSGLTLGDMRGVPYDDEKWDTFMDQLDLSQTSDIYTVLSGSAYSVGAFESLDKPATTESDGPQGISSMFGSAANGGCAWCSAPILAATFNEDLAYKMGAAVGQEGMSKGISAWYAPGIDTHRSAFSGRNFEYYSEDPLVAGKMASRVVSGAADNGVSCVIKHLFLNDFETNRAFVNTWCDEQTMREIYLRAFEIPLKEATTNLKYIADAEGTVETRQVRACNGIMTSMGSIGWDYAGTNYNLATNVLRGEMGFRGMIMTDMAENSNNSKDMMIRAGVDEYMYFMTGGVSDFKDISSATAQTAFREAVKHMCYMVANNSAMQGVAPGSIVYYTTSPWVYIVYVIQAVMVVIAAALVWTMIKRAKANKAQPELFKAPKKSGK